MPPHRVAVFVIDQEFSPDRAPDEPENWDRVANEPSSADGRGYTAIYRTVENGMTADLTIHCIPGKEVVEIVLDEYSDYPDPESRTRQFDVEVPKHKDEETFEDITDAWIKAVSDNEQ